MNDLQRKPKLDYIDSLRGAAIIMVIVVHVGDKLHHLSRGMETLSNYGQFGVQLFFVVSAFTLCLTMENRAGEKRALSKFFLRRYFRIAPLYYFGIVLYLCYFSFRPLVRGEALVYAPAYTFKNVLVNLLFINDFTPGVANNGIVPGGWSIGTETTFYVFFPLLFLFYMRIRSHKAALILVPILSVILSFFLLYLLEYAFTSLGKDQLWQNIRYGNFMYYTFLCQLPVFLLGMSLYFILQGVSKVRISTRIVCVPGFIIFLLLSAFLLIYYKSHIYLLPFTAGVAFVFLFVLYRETSSLSHPILSRIGQLSYSIYLFHFIFVWEGAKLFFKLLHPYFGSATIFMITTLVSLALASGVAILSEKYIENPGIKLGKRAVRRLDN